MNRDTRIESYRKIYAHLKEVKGLTNFEYSDEQKNLEFQFDGGPFHFHYCLFVNSDRVQIRAVMKTDMDDEKASMIAKELSSKMEGMSGTSYDNQIILQSNVIFFGVSDQEAAKMIYDKTCEFVRIIMEYVEEEFPDLMTETHTEPLSELEKMSGSNENHAAANEKEEEKEEHLKEESALDVDTQGTKEAEKTDAGSDATKEKRSDAPEGGSASEDQWTNAIYAQFSQAASHTARQDGWNKDTHKEEDDARMESKTIAPEKADDSRDEAIDTSELADRADLSAALEAPLNAPEDIKAMYEEMNFTFSLRKEQLDYSDQLIKQQRAYINAEKEQLLKERQELDSREKEVEEQENKLKSKWNNYNSAKKNQMERESALAEREAKARVISEKIEEKQTTLDGLVESNRMQKDELERLRIKTHEQRDMLDEEKEALKKDKKELEAQRIKLNERADELTAKEQKLRLMESQIAMRDKAVHDKMNDLKEMEYMARQMQLPGYKPDKNAMKGHAEAGKEREELFQKIKKLESEIKEEQSRHQMASSKANAAMEEIKEEKDILHKENLDLKKKCEAMEKENESLKEAVSECTLERNKKSSSLEELEKDKASLKERIRSAEEEKDSLQAEMKELKEKIAKDTILIDKARKRIDILKNESNQCIEDLENTGYHMEEVQGEGDQLFRGTKDEALFYVNRKIRVLYVEKPAKSKNQRILSEWNGEDMRFSYAYSITEKKATCRCVYTNIVEDLGAILTKFDELK